MDHHDDHDIYSELPDEISEKESSHQEDIASDFDLLDETIISRGKSFTSPKKVSSEFLLEVTHPRVSALKTAQTNKQKNSRSSELESQKSFCHTNDCLKPTHKKDVISNIPEKSPREVLTKEKIEEIKMLHEREMEENKKLKHSISVLYETTENLLRAKEKTLQYLQKRLSEAKGSRQVDDSIDVKLESISSSLGKDFKVGSMGASDVVQDLEKLSLYSKVKLKHGKNGEYYFMHSGCKELEPVNTNICLSPEGSLKDNSQNGSSCFLNTRKKCDTLETNSCDRLSSSECENQSPYLARRQRKRSVSSNRHRRSRSSERRKWSRSPGFSRRLSSPENSKRSPERSRRARSPVYRKGARSPDYTLRPKTPEIYKKYRNSGCTKRIGSPNNNKKCRSPDYNKRPRSPDYNKRPRRPRSPDCNRRPRSPDYNRRPRSPDCNRRPKSPDCNRRPKSPDYNRRPRSPDYNRRPDSNKRSQSPGYRRKQGDPDYDRKHRTPDYDKNPKSSGHSRMPKHPVYSRQSRRSKSPDFSEKTRRRDYHKKSISPDYRKRSKSPELSKRSQSPISSSMLRKLCSSDSSKRPKSPHSIKIQKSSDFPRSSSSWQTKTTLKSIRKESRKQKSPVSDRKMFKFEVDQRSCTSEDEEQRLRLRKLDRKQATHEKRRPTLPKEKYRNLGIIQSSPTLETDFVPESHSFHTLRKNRRVKSSKSEEEEVRNIRICVKNDCSLDSDKRLSCKLQSPQSDVSVSRKLLLKQMQTLQKKEKLNKTTEIKSMKIKKEMVDENGVLDSASLMELKLGKSLKRNESASNSESSSSELEEGEVVSD